MYLKFLLALLLQSVWHEDHSPFILWQSSIEQSAMHYHYITMLLRLLIMISISSLWGCSCQEL